MHRFLKFVFTSKGTVLVIVRLFIIIGVVFGPKISCDIVPLKLDFFNAKNFFQYSFGKVL